MTRDDIVDWIRRYAAAVAAQKQYLTELDAAIGDGDHGINMDRGMSEVCAKLDGLAERDIGAILNAVGMTLLSKVGGAAGPLYGTLFMRFSKETAGKLELTGSEFAAALDAGLTGIQQRGSARDGSSCRLLDLDDDPLSISPCPERAPYHASPLEPLLQPEPDHARCPPRSRDFHLPAAGGLRQAARCHRADVATAERYAERTTSAGHR